MPTRLRQRPRESQLDARVEALTLQDMAPEQPALDFSWGTPPGSHGSRGPKNILCVYMSVLLFSWEGGPTRLLTGFSERSVHPDQPVPFLCPAAPNTPLIKA